MRAKTIIGVMGPGSNSTAEDLVLAEELGRLIAKESWVLLTGGRNAGVMDAASKGAAQAGGLTVGILPGETKEAKSPFVNIPIVTGMGSARNNINVLSSDVIIACGTGLGTTSEIMLAIKAGKHVILLSQSKEGRDFLNSFQNNHLHFCNSPSEAIELVKSILASN